VSEQRDDDLEDSKRLMRMRSLGRGLRVGVRGKRGQAGEKESSKAHVIVNSSLAFGSMEAAILSARRDPKKIAAPESAAIFLNVLGQPINCS